MKFSYVPAYGFGKAKKLQLDKNDQLITPGPGKYNVNIFLKRKPLGKFGSSKRQELPDLENPGPGAYNIRYNIPKGPSYSIREKAKNIFEENENNPGPGSYEPKNLNILRNNFSFGQKYKENRKDIFPGPGKYKIRTEKDLLVPSSIFGNEKRFNSENLYNSPGPGKYDSNISKTSIQHPQYSFGKEKRISDYIDISPGPGSYKHREYVGNEGKKISIGSKFISKSIDLGPGPGQYQINNYNSLFKSLPNIKIGKSKRFLDSNLIIPSPGPGEYNDEDKYRFIKNNKPSWKIGTSTRKPLNDITDSPGPGKYNISKEIGEGAPQYSMRIKEKESLNLYNTPGPGKYNSGDFNNFKSYPAWKIGTSDRNDESYKMQIKEGFPGPGTYGNYDKYLNNAPKYGFGTEKRIKDKYNDNPGPGSYHIPCSIVEVNNYTRDQGIFDDKFKFI